MTQQPVELILLRQWASYMAMPIWIADSDENVLYYNEPAEVILGRRFDEAGELKLEEVPEVLKLTAEDGSPLAAADFPPLIALRNRRPAHRLVRGVGLDGVSRTVEVTAFPIEGQGERHLGAVAVFWEVSDD